VPTGPEGRIAELVAANELAIRQRDELIVEQNDLVAEREALIAEREELIGQRDTLAEHVAAIEASTSWRITRPLRRSSASVRAAIGLRQS
jgi:hypothetical protein